MSETPMIRDHVNLRSPAVARFGRTMLALAVAATTLACELVIGDRPSSNPSNNAPGNDAGNASHGGSGGRPGSGGTHAAGTTAAGGGRASGGSAQSDGGRPPMLAGGAGMGGGG